MSQDSPRWCKRCQAWGEHHTDRHPEPEQIMETRGWKTCDDCGVLYEEAYCPRCEEMG
jgi:hypothetical protein